MDEESIITDPNQLNISPSLDDTRRASIRNALKEYQAECLKQNLRTLCIHLQAVQDEGEEETRAGNHTAEEVEEAIQSTFERHYLPWDETTILLSPEDSPERTRLIHEYALDGVSHEPLDLVARKAWWNSIWSTILQYKDKIPPEKFPPGLPDDLQYLTTLVNGILSPGLEDWREIQQRDFIPPTSEVRLRDGEVGELCVPSLATWDPYQPYDRTAAFNPHNLFAAHTWSKDWDIAVGLSTSCWPQGTGDRSFVLYCCPKGGDGEWRWRYGWDHAKFDAAEGLFESVEEYFKWYAHCAEQVAEEVETEGLEFGW